MNQSSSSGLTDAQMNSVTPDSPHALISLRPSQ